VRPPEGNANTLSQESLFKCDPASDRAASPARVWRLTSPQWTRTFFDGGASAARGGREPLSVLGGGTRFANYSSVGGMDLPTFEGLLASAQGWATYWASAADAPACVKDASAPSLDCFKALVQARGFAVFRRPATPEEIDLYARRILDAVTTLGKKEGVIVGLGSMALAAEALFRWEVGEGTPDARGRRPLSAWEMASALSYTLRDAPPDAELQKAALANALGTPEQIRVQVLRLLAGVATPGSAYPTVMKRFMTEYFRYDEASAVFKDPSHQATVKDWANKQMLPDEENKYGIDTGKRDPQRWTEPWVQAVIAGGKNVIATLLADKASTRLPSDPQSGPRVGILTERSFLLTNSLADENDPIRRGKFIYESLLCNVLPPIPLGIVNAIPEDKKRTLRERLAIHAVEPSCRGCHQFLEGVGLGLEGYDDFGNARTTEAGRPVDASGALLGSNDQDGPFKDATELSQKLARSNHVRQCFIRQTFRYFMGRNEQPADACSLRAVDETYAKSGGSLLEAIVGLFSSDAFRYRVTVSTQEVK
jgi:hypothetical protein